jgi:hypothetical protein
MRCIIVFTEVVAVTNRYRAIEGNPNPSNECPQVRKAWWNREDKLSPARAKMRIIVFLLGRFYLIIYY